MFLTLGLLDFLVDKCGPRFIEFVGSKEFLQSLI